MPPPRKIFRLRVTVANPNYKTTQPTEEELISLEENEKETDHDKLHRFGYVLVETGEPTLFGSYCVAILQTISKQFHCQLDFEQIPQYSQTKEWLILTSHISDISENSLLLNTLSNLVLFNDAQHEDDARLEKIYNSICKLFGNFSIKIISNLENCNPSTWAKNSKQILLYREDDRFFSIIPRQQLHPSPEPRALSIIEDLSSSKLLINHVKKKLNKEGELFLMHQISMRELQDLREIRTVHQLLANSSPFVPMDATLFKELKSCLETKVAISAADEDQDETGLSYQAQQNILVALKEQIAHASNMALEEAIIAVTSKHKISALNSANEMNDIKEDINKSASLVLEQEKKLRDIKAKDSARALQIQDKIKQLQTEQVVNEVKQAIRNTKPNSSFSHLNNKIAQIKNWQDLRNFLNEVEIMSAEKMTALDKISEKEVEELCQLLLYQVTSRPSIKQEKEKVIIEVEATHIFLSECLKKVQTRIAQYRELKSSTQIEVHFKGEVSLTIDTNLEQAHFHGANLHMSGKNVYVRGEIRDQIVVINVTGNNGIEHEKTKPDLPSAFGAHGNEGEHGNPGESGGHVTINAAEKIHDIHLLQVIAIGGNGARGQDGGDGKVGSNGVNGRDGSVDDEHPSRWSTMTQISRGVPGTEGKAGGDSGQIGRGGEGGIGGDITIKQGIDEFKVTPDSKGSSHVGKFETKNGEKGDDGDLGNPGEGGQGGSHGEDKAWVYEEHFPSASWKRHTGHNLYIAKQKEWYNWGYYCEEGRLNPPAHNGTKGTRKSEHNQKHRTPAAKRGDISNPASIGVSSQNDILRNSNNNHDAVISNLENELSSQFQQQATQEELQAESVEQMDDDREILEQHAAKKARHNKKVQQLDQLLQSVRQVYSTFHEELVTISAQQQAEEAYKLTKDQKSVCHSKKERKDDVYHTKEDHLTQDESTFSDTVLSAMQILEKQKSPSVYSAVEKFILIFFQNRNPALETEALAVLQKLDQQGIQKVGVLEILQVIGTFLPGLYPHFKDSPETLATFSLTKKISSVAQQLLRICEISGNEKNELESFLISSSATLSLTQKENLVHILDAIYTAEYLPKLAQATQANKQSSTIDESLSPEVNQDQHSKIILKTLTASRALHAALPKLTANSTTSCLDRLVKCVQKQGSDTPPNIINTIFEKISKDLSLPNIMGDDVKWDPKSSQFTRLLFMAEYYEYEVTMMDNLMQISHNLNKTGSYEKGQKLRTILNKVYQSNHFQPRRERLAEKFAALGENGKVPQFISIVESMGTFEQRIKMYDAVLATPTAEVNWESTFARLKSKTLELDQFMSVCQTLNNVQNTDELKQTIQQIQFTLQHADFPLANLSLIEVGLRKLLDDLHSKKSSNINLYSPHISSINKSITLFWGRQYNLHVKLPVQESYSNDKFDEWCSTVVATAQELVGSTQILSKVEYMQFLRLKLGHLHYWALIEGLLGELESGVNIKGDGKEKDRLRHILDQLYKFSSPTFTHNSTDSAITKLVESLNSIILWNNEEATDVSTRINQFQSDLLAACLPGNEPHLEKICSDVHMKMFCDWTNASSLSEFFSKKVEKPQDKSKIKITLTQLRPLVRSTKISKEAKADIIKMIGVIEKVVLIEANLVENNKLQADVDIAIKKLQSDRTQTISRLEVTSRLRIQLLLNSQSLLHSNSQPVSSYISQCNAKFTGRWKTFEQLEESVFISAYKQCISQNSVPSWMVEESSQIGPRDIKQLQNMKDTEIDVIIPVLLTKHVMNKLTQYILRQEETAEKCPPIVLNSLIESYEREVDQILLEVHKSTRNGFLILKRCWKQLLTLGGISEEMHEQCQLEALFSIYSCKNNANKFWEICKNSGGSTTANPIRDKFFNPDQDINGIREFISRLLISKTIPKEQYEAFLDTFETRDDLGPENMANFKSLLTSEEDKYFQALTANNATIDINMLRRMTDWHEELQHLFVQMGFKNMSLCQTEEDKSALIRVLDDWKEVLHNRGQTNKEHNFWTQILAQLFQRVQTFPTKYSDVINFLQFSLQQTSLTDVDNIVQNHLPGSYVKEILLKKLCLTLAKGSLNLQLVKKIEEKVRLFIFGKDDNNVIQFLQNFVNEAKGADLLSIFQLFENLEDFPESILVACSKLPLYEWRKQFSVPTYQKLISDREQDQYIIQLAIEAEDKFRAHMLQFATHLMKLKVKLSDLATYFENFINGEWTLNSTVMELILSSKRVSNISQIINDYMKKVGEQETTGKELIDAIQNLTLNQVNADVKKYSTQVLQDMNKIHAQFNEASSIVGFSTRIKNWNEAEIKEWRKAVSNKVKDGVDIHSNENKIEIFAVILQAVLIFSAGKYRYTLRDTQLASVLFFLNAKQNAKGRFAEIATSEGKTLISSVQAILFALAGANVDIVTSSSVLADDAYTKMCKLFAIFDLGVGNISDKDCRKGGKEGEKLLEKLYTNVILIGDAASFETDYLSCKYLDKSYTKGRHAQYVIVDEVDSMLLDKGSNVLYISHTIPELRWLKPIFIDIWALANNASLERFQMKEVIVQKWIPAEGALKFPEFLRSFVQGRISIWINNAFAAIDMMKDVPYINSKGDDGSQEGEKVTIIDADTGVEQKHMQYSYGLHQFLELKEDNKISPESLKSVFVSNLGYFANFRGRIFGITGTLGDDYSRKILGELYTVDFFKMPRFKVRQCKMEPAQFPIGREAYFACAQASVNDRRQTQPVLFICENVKSSHELFGHLSKHVVAEKLFQINSTVEYANFGEKMKGKCLKAGDVIISTNLAGRGTDLTIDPATKGLHVVVTFLPPNRRVEKQAFGRTARAGQKGSTEYIVQSPELKEGEEPRNIKVCQREMYYQEKERLDSIKEREVPRILFEEQLFKLMSDKLDKLRIKLTRPIQIIGIPLHKEVLGIAISTSSMSKNVLKTTTEIIKNRWAFWLDGIQPKLQMLHLSTDEKEKILKDFSSFWDQVESDALHNNSICKSPSDHVKLAKAYEDDGKIVSSAEILDLGISKESNYHEILQYYRGVCELRLDSENKTLARRRKSRRCLKSAQAKILQRQQELQDVLGKFKYLKEQEAARKIESASPTEQKKEGGEDEKKTSNFCEQIQNEINMLQIHNSEFLIPSLGHTIVPETFKTLTMVNDDAAESKAIYDALLEKSGLLKPLRISKKLTKTKDNQLLYKDKEIKFEGELDSCKEPLKQFLLKKAKSSQKTVSISDFTSMVVKREEFLNILKESDFIQTPVQNYTLYEISYDEDIFGEKFTSFPKLKVTIGMLLSKHNLRSLTLNEVLELFSPFSKEPKQILDALIKDGYVLERSQFEAMILDEVHKKLKIKDGQLTGLPAKMEPYHHILKSWLYQLDSNGEATLINPKVDTQFLSVLPFECNLGAEDIFNCCANLGYVKKSKMKWSLHTNFDEEIKRKEQIEAIFEYDPDSSQTQLISTLHKTFKKFHPKETENEDLVKYLAQINEILFKSIGQIKTLPRLKIDSKYRNLLECYTGGSIPREVMDFISEDFDRIPKIKEKIPWWCNGATYVALLGVLQIALGVTVGVLSGGTLANVSSMLISEGGSDIMYAIQAGLTGSFSWKSYGVHKAFSVAASILTGGLAGISGASIGTIVMMEVAEEIMKKVVWTLGRYALQGLATTVINMGIEKALDELKQSLIGKIRVGFKAWAATNQAYIDAKGVLAKSLNDFYAATYTNNQVQNLLSTATDVLGVQVKTSIYSHAFTTALQRVASFYTAKLMDKLTSAFGNGIVDKALKLYKFLSQFSPTVVTRAMTAIQTFAVDYINGMANYFRNEAAKLRAKQEGRIIHIDRMDKTKFDKKRDQFLNQIDIQVADEGVNKFQHEVAEPALKQWSGRLMESKCHSMFKGKHADFTKHASFSSYKQKEGSIWSRMNAPSVHMATDMNYRAGCDDENRVRNNVLNGFGTQVQKLLETDFITFLNFPKDSDSDNVMPYFKLNGKSSEYLKDAEKLGIPIIRTFFF